MPSVASEAHPVLLPRPASNSTRSHTEPEAREPAAPFAELLDRPDPPEPPPARRQARSERPERADRPKPKDDRGTDAKPAQENKKESTPEPADPKDGKATADNGATSAKDTSAETVHASATRDGDAAPSADAKFEPDPASLAALLDATTPAVTAAPAAVIAVPQTLAAAIGTLEAEQAAPQAAGGMAPNAALKPGPALGGKSFDAAAESGAPAGSQAGASRIDSAKDGQTRGNGSQAGSDFHRAAPDILTKPDVSAPSRQTGDAGAAVKASAEAVQNLGLASTTNAAVPASTNPHAPAQAQTQAQGQAVAVPLAGVAVAITTQAQAGNRHFEIRLDPPELGRIDVKLDVDRDGNVSTRLVVDRADTLDLLKRDASALERALQQSGLKTSDNALEFSLRQQGLARDDTAGQTGAQLIVPDDDPAPLEAMRQGYGRLLGLGGGLDIRV